MRCTIQSPVLGAHMHVNLTLSKCRGRWTMEVGKKLKRKRHRLINTPSTAGRLVLAVPCERVPWPDETVDIPQQQEINFRLHR